MVYIFYEREVSRVLNIVKAQNKPLKFETASIKFTYKLSDILLAEKEHIHSVLIIYIDLTV